MLHGGWAWSPCAWSRSAGWTSVGLDDRGSWSACGPPSRAARATEASGERSPRASACPDRRSELHRGGARGSRCSRSSALGQEQGRDAPSRNGNGLIAALTWPMLRFHRPWPGRSPTARKNWTSCASGWRPSTPSCRSTDDDRGDLVRHVPVRHLRRGLVRRGERRRRDLHVSERERDLSIENNVRGSDGQDRPRPWPGWIAAPTGSASRCGKPIEKARLKAPPYADLSHQATRKPSPGGRGWRRAAFGDPACVVAAGALFLDQLSKAWVQHALSGRPTDHA